MALGVYHLSINIAQNEIVYVDFDVGVGAIICLCVCLSFSMFVCQLMHMDVKMGVGSRHPSVCQSACLSVHPFNMAVAIYLSGVGQYSMSTLTSFISE